MVIKIVRQMAGLIFLLVTQAAISCPPQPGEAAVVNTADTAVAIAKKSWESVHDKTGWNSVYEKSSTDKFEPYAATLEGEVWIVRGTIPEGFHGETLETRVCRSDGSVFVESVRK